MVTLAQMIPGRDVVIESTVNDVTSGNEDTPLGNEEGRPKRNNAPRGCLKYRYDRRHEFELAAPRDN